MVSIYRYRDRSRLAYIKYSSALALRFSTVVQDQLREFIRSGLGQWETQRREDSVALPEVMQ
jgi:hypothetical protein